MEPAGSVRTSLIIDWRYIMQKYTLGCLEIVIYLVANITKNGMPFDVKCLKGEWEPHPEVPYQLFRVIEITRDTKSDLKFQFGVRDAQGIIDPLEWEAGVWWKYRHPKGVTLWVALDEKTDEVFRIRVWEQNGKFVLNVEHHDEPVEQLPAKPATKPAHVEVVYQRVEVIKPRHNNGNDHRNGDNKDEKSRDFRRAKDAVSTQDDERSERGHQEDSLKDIDDSASPEEIANVMSRDHSLVQRIDLKDLPPVN